jgi:hypothetical protein
MATVSTLSAGNECFEAYMNGDTNDEFDFDFIKRLLSEDFLNETETRESHESDESHETHETHESRTVAPVFAVLPTVLPVPLPLNEKDLERKRRNRISSAAGRQKIRDQLKSIKMRCSFLEWENDQLRRIFETNQNYGIPVPPPAHEYGKIALPPLTETRSNNIRILSPNK